MAGRAGAQNIPEPPRPTCVEGCTRGGSSSTESVDERNARWAAIAEARREAKAERDAENAKRKAQKAAQKLKDQQDKQKAQDEARQKAENDRKAAEAEQQRQLNAQREREAEAERQRQLAIEAQRLQAAFDTIKPDAVGALKGVEGDPAGASRADDGLNLKGVDGEPGTGSAQPDWMATITDPQVAKIAHHLGSIVPPLPIPKEEVALNWKKVYLNDDRLMNTADWVVAAWETTGVLGAPIKIPCKALLIAGKSFIAQEDSAYLYLVKKDQDYNAALAYLKNPAQAQTFAHLLDDVRQHRELPANADPAMVKAVRAITDPKLGNTATVVWDSMTSREALSAMLRKAWIETATEMLSPSTEGLLRDEAERKAMFDSVRLNREAARKMMELATTTEVQRAECKAAIEYANHLSAGLYNLEKVASGIADEEISQHMGDAYDVIADHLFPPEAKGREY